MHPQAGGDEQNVLGIQVQDLSLLQIELEAASLAKQQADRTTEGIRQPGIPWPPVNWQICKPGRA